MNKDIDVNSTASKFFTEINAPELNLNTDQKESAKENEDKNVKVVEKIVYVEVKPETKSLRMNLLIKPSTKKALDKKAKKEKLSVNALVNNIIEAALKSETEAEKKN